MNELVTLLQQVDPNDVAEVAQTGAEVARTVALVPLLAALIERVIEYFFAWVPSRGKPVVSLVLGVLASLGFDADLLAALGYAAAYPYVGEVVTGILLSGGSNYLANWLKARGMHIPASIIPGR